MTHLAHFDLWRRKFQGNNAAFAFRFQGNDGVFAGSEFPRCLAQQTLCWIFFLGHIFCTCNWNIWMLFRVNGYCLSFLSIHTLSWITNCSFPHPWVWWSLSWRWPRRRSRAPWRWRRTAPRASSTCRTRARWTDSPPRGSCRACTAPPSPCPTCTNWTTFFRPCTSASQAAYLSHTADVVVVDSPDPAQKVNWRQPFNCNALITWCCMALTLISALVEVCIQWE